MVSQWVETVMMTGVAAVLGAVVLVRSGLMQTARSFGVMERLFAERTVFISFSPLSDVLLLFFHVRVFVQVNR